MKDKIQNAYLAGFLDGEGYIAIMKRRERQVKDMYIPYIVVANTQKEVLNLFQKQFGGKLYLKKFKNYKWKNCYRWDIRGSQVKKILECLLPYLVLKRKQAESLLKYITKSYGVYFRKGCKGMPIQFHKDRIKIYEKMRQLNRKGKL